jgi:hypothetical protein
MGQFFCHIGALAMSEIYYIFFPHLQNSIYPNTWHVWHEGTWAYIHTYMAHFLECFLPLNKLHTAFFKKLSIKVWNCWRIKALLSIICNIQIISCKIHHPPFQACFRTWVSCSFTSTNACNCHTWVISAHPDCHFSNTCAQSFLCLSGYFSFLQWNCH